MQIISREDARAAGLRVYFSGNPCMRGSLAPRLVANGECTCDSCAEKRRQSGHWMTVLVGLAGSSANEVSVEWGSEYSNEGNLVSTILRGWLSLPVNDLRFEAQI